jgi:UDP-galactose transporter B1
MAAQNGGVLRQANGKLSAIADGAILAGKNDAALRTDREAKSSANTLNLLICAGGIYVSLYVFLPSLTAHC